MRCPSCGIEIQPGVANCPSCGTSLNTSETSSSYEDGTDSIPYVPYSFDLAGQTSTVSAIPASEKERQLLAPGRSTPDTNVQPLKQPKQSQAQDISKVTAKGCLTALSAMEPSISMLPQKITSMIAWLRVNTVISFFGCR